MAQSISYLALGDSYTIGESVVIEQRFPEQIASILRKDELESKVTLVAKTGWTTDELAKAIKEKQDLEPSYDLVSLLIGVNNQYRGYHIDQYRTEFKSLLDTAIKFASDRPSKVFVLSIPDYGVTPFGQTRSNKDQIGDELDQYNNIAKDICQEKGVVFFDITPISRKAMDDLDLVASDKLHPSGKMYTQWVALIYAEVKKIIHQ